MCSPPLFKGGGEPDFLKNRKGGGTSEKLTQGGESKRGGKENSKKRGGKGFFLDSNQAHFEQSLRYLKTIFKKFSPAAAICIIIGSFMHKTCSFLLTTLLKQKKVQNKLKSCYREKKGDYKSKSFSR